MIKWSGQKYNDVNSTASLHKAPRTKKASTIENISAKSAEFITASDDEDEVEEDDEEEADEEAVEDEEDEEMEE